MGSNAITQKQIDLRIYCIEQGYDDRTSAKICKIKESAFGQWRRVRQNQEFSSKYIKPLNEVKNRYRKEDKVVLTANDVAKYHHNDNSKQPYNNNILLRVEINPNLDLPEPAMKYSDGPKGSHIGVVIGSKCDKSPATFVHAKKEFSNLMYKTTKNVCCKAVRNG